MAWWVMPALTLGAALWTKYKRTAGKFRWVRMTEKKLRQLPPGLVLARELETGDSLPDAPEGYSWKAVTMLLSTTPLTPPQEVVIHALEPKLPITRPASMEAMASSYMTAQEAKGSPNLGWWQNLLTVEDCYEYEIIPPAAVSRNDAADLATARGAAEMGDIGSSYLTSQEVQRSPALGYFLTEEYVQSAPRLGEALALDLRKQGVRLRDIPPGNARAKDFVVLEDCSVHQVVRGGPGGVLRIREIKPRKGRERDVHAASGRVQCAFGVRPA